MSIRTELARLKKLTAAKEQAKENTPAGYKAQLEKDRAECEAWKRRFIEGGPEAAGRLPDHLLFGPREYTEKVMKSDACFTARLEGKVPPLGYLRGMTAADRRAADGLCGLMYQVTRNLEIREGVNPDEGEGEFAVWATLDPAMWSSPTVNDAPQEEDLTKLTDAELEERIAAAERQVAESDKRLAALRE